MGQPGVSVQQLTTSLERGLEVGAQVFVNYAAGQERPVRSQLRGWAVGRYMLLDEPRDNPGTVEFRPGAPWKLKFVANGKVCVAETEYIERSVPSAGAVYVTFPKLIAAHPLRQHYRTEVELPGRYGGADAEGAAPDSMKETTIRDLSLGGCAFDADEEIQSDARVFLAFSPAPGERPQVFAGRARRCTPSGDKFAIGVQFDELDAEQRPALIRLLGTSALEVDPISGEGATG